MDRCFLRHSCTSRVQTCPRLVERSPAMPLASKILEAIAQNNKMVDGQARRGSGRALKGSIRDRVYQSFPATSNRDDCHDHQHERRQPVAMARNKNKAAAVHVRAPAAATFFVLRRKLGWRITPWISIYVDINHPTRGINPSQNSAAFPLRPQMHENSDGPALSLFHPISLIRASQRLHHAFEPLHLFCCHTPPCSGRCVSTLAADVHASLFQCSP